MWLLPVLLAASACWQHETNGSDLEEFGSLFKPADRIIGGVEASHHVPFQVMLNIDHDNVPDDLCGGSLIHVQWVLTAGHCLVNTNPNLTDFGGPAAKVVVRLGVLDQSYPEPHVQIIGTKELFYKDGLADMLLALEWSQDIGLVQLDRPALLTNFVDTIPLPYSRRSETFENELATISGWGLTSSNNTAAESKLHVVNARVISHQLCLAQYGARFVTKNSICTSGQGPRGSCFGDSGGPLYIHDSHGKPLLIGVNSFKSPVCEDGQASVFLRVTNFLDWIDDIIYSKTENQP